MNAPIRYDAPGDLPPTGRIPHENVKVVEGGWVACPGCKKILNADEFLNTSCERKKP